MATNKNNNDIDNTEEIMEAEIIGETTPPPLRNVTPPSQQQTVDTTHDHVTVKCAGAEYAYKLAQYINKMEGVSATISKANPSTMTVLNVTDSQIAEIKKMKTVYENGHAVAAVINKVADVTTTSGMFVASNVVVPVARGGIKLAGGAVRIGAVVATETATTAYNTTLETGMAVCEELSNDYEVNKAINNTKMIWGKAKNWFNKKINDEDKNFIIEANEQGEIVI